MILVAGVHVGTVIDEHVHDPGVGQSVEGRLLIVVAGVNVGAVLDEQSRDVAVLYIVEWGSAPVITDMNISSIPYKYPCFFNILYVLEASIAHHWVNYGPHCLSEFPDLANDMYSLKYVFFPGRFLLRLVRCRCTRGAGIGFVDWLSWLEIDFCASGLWLRFCWKLDKSFFVKHLERYMANDTRKAIH